MSEQKVDETKPSETKPKKMVKNNVAIALGIICIFLVACLAGAVVLMNTQITNLQNQVNYLTNTSRLQKQVDNLTSILNLIESTVWFPYTYLSQPANSYTNWTFYPPYAGYVVVIVGASDTPLTYIRVTNSLNTGGPDGVSYDNQA